MSSSDWTKQGRAPGAARGRGARYRHRFVAVAAALFLFATGCVDAPSGVSATDQADPLAETFDALSREASQNGDLARSDGFAHAALAVRSGVTPSRLEVQMGTTTSVYDAFVTAVEWDDAVGPGIRPPPRRGLVAWQRTNDGVTRVLSLSTPNDSAPILSPLSLGMATSTVAVFAGASAMYHEGRNTPQGRPDLSGAWYGTTGWVKLRQGQVVGACPDRWKAGPGLALQRCEEVRYLVRFDVTMQRLAGRPPQVTDGATRRLTSVGEPVVNGVRLRLAGAMAAGRER